MSLKTVVLASDASMADVMRRFRQQPGAKILRARHIRGDRFPEGAWSIQFIGETPNLDGLIREQHP